MTLAHGIAQRSLCTRDKVGAVIVSADNTPLMASYNGSPSGFPHNDQPCTEWCPRARGDDEVWTHDGTSGPGHETHYIQGVTYWRYLSDHPDNQWQPLSDDATYEALGYVKKTRLSPTYDDCPALHAEANGLSRSNHIHRSGGTIYVTSDVCHTCAKLVANSGLVRVVVDRRTPREYRNSDQSYEFLKTCGLEVVLIV
jgi:deoxycytidylate deaminase